MIAKSFIDPFGAVVAIDDIKVEYIPCKSEFRGQHICHLYLPYDVICYVLNLQVANLTEAQVRYAKRFLAISREVRKKQYKFAIFL